MLYLFKSIYSNFPTNNLFITKIFHIFALYMRTQLGTNS